MIKRIAFQLIEHRGVELAHPATNRIDYETEALFSQALASLHC